MKIQRRVTRSAICLAQTLLLIAGNGAFAIASSSGNSESLDVSEKAVFGETHTKLSENTRIKDLELNLFGKTKSGNPASRVAQISKALGGKKDNLLLPAIAPQLDTSQSIQSAGSPSAAPSYDSASSDVAPDTAAGAAEKETLRNAMQLYSQGRTDEAERQFRKVLGMNMRNVDALYNLGVIDEAKGDYKGALSNYQQASKINPSDSDLASAVTAVQSKIQDKTVADQRQQQVQQQAVAAAKQQQKTDSLKSMISDAAGAYKSGNYDKAISNLQYVSQQAPNDPDVLYALGQAYKGKGNVIKARAVFNQAIAIDPNNQLYKNAIADLNRVANNGGSSSSSPSYGNDGLPAAAPDYRNRNNSVGQLTSFSGDDSGGSPSASSSSGGGQLTPFSGIAETNDRNYGGNNFSSSNYDSSPTSLGSVRGIGSTGNFGGMGMGMLGGGLSSLLMGGTRYSGYNNNRYNRGYGGGNTSYRLKRVAIGSLGGMAAGALYGSMSHGNVKSSAMRGALMGGAMSLFTGF